MASKRSEVQEDVRLRIIRLLSKEPEMSIRQIANAVSISNGSAYYVIMALVEKGFVKLQKFRNNPRKGQYSYLLTAKGIREKSFLTHRFIVRKRQEYIALRTEIEILEEEVGLKKEQQLSLRVWK
jgi:EPS-associated MarR family transcriptional regulator